MTELERQAIEAYYQEHRLKIEQAQQQVQAVLGLTLDPRDFQFRGQATDYLYFQYEGRQFRVDVRYTRAHLYLLCHCTCGHQEEGRLVDTLASYGYLLLHPTHLKCLPNKGCSWWRAAFRKVTRTLPQLSDLPIPAGNSR
jgi:hypothetical protein